MNIREIREQLENDQESIDENEAKVFFTEIHEDHLDLRNYALGLTLLKQHLYCDGKINRLLTSSAAKLEKLLEGNTKLPTEEESIYIYSTSLKNDNLQRIKDFNDFYPMLSLCFDENFLVLTNYLLETNYLDEDLEKKLISLTKNIVSISNVIIPIEGINDVNVGEKEYTKLCKFTLKKIKKVEKELEKEEKVKRLK